MDGVLPRPRSPAQDCALAHARAMELSAVVLLLALGRSQSAQLHSAQPRPDYLEPSTPPLKPLDGAFAIHWRLTVRKARFGCDWTAPVAYPTEARHFHACLFHRRPRHPHRGTLRISAPSPVSQRPFLTRKSPASSNAASMPKPSSSPYAAAAGGRQLTRKLQVVSYLAESRAPYLNQFVNLETSRPRAWATLIAATLAAVWKRCKGEYLIRRHGLL